MINLNTSNIPSSELCGKCKGRGYCGKPCPILARISRSFPKPKLHFSGSSPPEIFVGHNNYPNINTGFLSPEVHGDTLGYSLPEIWHKQNFNIPQILGLRSRMIYSRFKSNIRDVRKETKLLSVMKEISLANKSVSVEIFLKKFPKQDFNINTHIPLICNPAPLKYARLEENPKVETKVEYLTNDTDLKAADGIKELYAGKISTSHIIKILSAGLLGRKTTRKLVPTRWSITSVDDTLSKHLLQKIRYYPELSEILVFHSEYIGNHYEFLLLPDKFSFEVIEAKMSGSVWNPAGELYYMQDYEGFNGRKNYAENVTGAYYANRLALVEYLESIKKQASCLVIRECRPEYYAPLGVGVLREASRQAFNNLPESSQNLQEAFRSMQSRMKLLVSFFTEKSWLLKNYKKQTRLSNFNL